MQILLLGGSGDIGFNVVEHLSSMKEIQQLVIADNHIKLGQEKQRQAQIKTKIDFIPLQLGEEMHTMATLMEEFDYVINCIGPFYQYGVPIAQAAIAAGVHFMDICDEWSTTKELLAMDKRVKERGIILLTGMGWSPGLTNLAVKKIIQDLQEIEKVTISLGSNSSGIKGLGMIKHLLYCRREEPFFYREGRLVKPSQHQERSMIEFLPPFQEVMVNTITHPELITIPQYFPEIKHLQVQGALTPPWLNQLVFRLAKFPLFRSDKYLEGLASQLYRYQLLFSRSRHFFSTFRVDVWGKKDQERRHRVLQLIEKKGQLVGISVVTALKMLQKQQSLSPGVYAPEGCLDPHLFFQKTASSGLEIVEREE